VHARVSPGKEPRTVNPRVSPAKQARTVHARVSPAKEPRTVHARVSPPNAVCSRVTGGFSGPGFGLWAGKEILRWPSEGVPAEISLRPQAPPRGFDSALPHL
jgi:hypothetical protein